MAKNNLFLGTARGSVGDVTFYRANGQQIARARVRQIRNPNSRGQLVNRAILATISQAYRAGRAIFDHSFEGKSTGADNQRTFLKRNIDMLRLKVNAELAAGTPAAAGDVAVVARSSASPVPNAYLVSEGTLFQNLFTVTPQQGSDHKMVATLPAADGATTASEWAAAHGIEPGDIYTLVAFGIRQSSGWTATDAAYSQQFEGAFGFIRLKVLPQEEWGTTEIASATFADLFEMNFANATPLPESTLLAGASINIDQVVSSAAVGALGVIKSREDSGLRSTTVLSLPSFPFIGIKSEYLLDAWTPGQGDSVGSDLILEGGDF